MFPDFLRSQTDVCLFCIASHGILPVCVSVYKSLCSSVTSFYRTVSAIVLFLYKIILPGTEV